MKTILMNTEMTKAILDGRKVQTRRVIGDIPMGLHYGQQIMDYGLSNVYCDDFNGKELSYDVQTHIDACGSYTARTKYQIGDILWVREPASIVGVNSLDNTMKYNYMTDTSGNNCKSISIPSRFIDDEAYNPYPKWIENCQGIPNGCIKEMARIFLKITNVRVERVQDISYEDMYFEGIDDRQVRDVEMPNYVGYVCDAYVGYSHNEYVKAGWIKLWNKTAPKEYRWEDNPYVFVYEFERVEKDQGGQS